jgi:hypothetical protein
MAATRPLTISVQGENISLVTYAVLPRMKRIVGISAGREAAGKNWWPNIGRGYRRCDPAMLRPPQKNLTRLAASSAVSGCGKERAGAVRSTRAKRASKNQELNGIGEPGAAWQL